MDRVGSSVVWDLLTLGRKVTLANSTYKKVRVGIILTAVC